MFISQRCQISKYRELLRNTKHSAAYAEVTFRSDTEFASSPKPGATACVPHDVRLTFVDGYGIISEERK